MTEEQSKSEDAQRTYEKKYGAVAFPGKRTGFAVVVGMAQENFSVQPERRHLYVLDEFESEDMRELLRQCKVLDFKHGLEKWIGNWRNDAAQRFICEMNEEAKVANPWTEPRRQFNLTATPILDMDDPYQFIVPELKKLLKPKEKQLWLEESKIAVYLTDIRSDEISELKFGDFPALEAVAFAVTELIRDAKHELDRRMRPRPHPAYGRRNVLDFYRGGSGGYGRRRR